MVGRPRGRKKNSNLQLLRRGEGHKAGEGQVVLLSGDAGIGKSRSTAELWRHTGEQKQRACALLTHRAHGQPTPSIIEQIKSAASLARDDGQSTPGLTSWTRCSRERLLGSKGHGPFAEMRSGPNDGR